MQYLPGFTVQCINPLCEAAAGRRRSLLYNGYGTGRAIQQARTSVVEKDVILTQTGYEKLKETIDELETVKRREVADRIKAA